MKLIVVVEDNYKLRAKIPRESYFLTAICQYLTKHTQKKNTLITILWKLYIVQIFHSTPVGEKKVAALTPATA